MSLSIEIQDTLPETATVIVEPGGLIGIESVPASWDRALDLKERIQSVESHLLPLRAMFGAELYVLKKSMGHDVRGGDRRSNPTKSGMIGTWDDLCRKKLNLTDDSANKQIEVFLIAVDRARDLLGEQSPEFRVLVTPPSLLNGEDIKTLADVLTRVLPEKNQNQLLRKMRAAKAPKPAHTLSTADRQKGAAAAAAAKNKLTDDEGDPERAAQLVASVQFRALLDDLDEIEKEICKLRFHKDLETYLCALKLVAPEDAPEVAPDKIIGLLKYRDSSARVRSEIEAGMKAISQKIETFIEAKYQSAAADQPRRKTKSLKK